MNKKMVFLAAFMLTACSANSLQHGAEGVRITHNEPDASCTYLGDVTGSQGNFSREDGRQIATSRRGPEMI